MISKRSRLDSGDVAVDITVIQYKSYFKKQSGQSEFGNVQDIKRLSATWGEYSFKLSFFL